MAASVLPSWGPGCPQQHSCHPALLKCLEQLPHNWPSQCACGASLLACQSLFVIINRNQRKENASEERDHGEESDRHEGGNELEKEGRKRRRQVRMGSEGRGEGGGSGQLRSPVFPGCC